MSSHQFAHLSYSIFALQCYKIVNTMLAHAAQ